MTAARFPLAGPLIAVIAAAMMVGTSSPGGDVRGTRAAVEEQFPPRPAHGGEPAEAARLRRRPVNFGEYDADRRPAGSTSGARSSTPAARDNQNNPIRNIRIEISRGLSGSFDRAMLWLGQSV